MTIHIAGAHSEALALESATGAVVKPSEWELTELFTSRLGDISHKFYKDVLSGEVRALNPRLRSPIEIAKSHIEGSLVVLRPWFLSGIRPAAKLANEVLWFLDGEELPGALAALDVIRTTLRSSNEVVRLLPVEPEVALAAIDEAVLELLSLLEQATVSELPLLGEAMFKHVFSSKRKYTSSLQKTLPKARILCNELWRKDVASEAVELYLTAVREAGNLRHEPEYVKLEGELSEQSLKLEVEALWRTHTAN